MSGLNAGRLDREITLQTATVLTDDTTGQAITSWDDEETIWAEWLPSGTREFWQTRQIHSEIEGVYKTYYRDDVFPETSRIVGHDGRTYDVKPPIEIGRQEGLLIPVVARGETP